MSASKSVDFDPMKRKEAMELVSAYYKINNRKVAKQLFDLIIGLSKSGTHLPQDAKQDADKE